MRMTKVITINICVLGLFIGSGIISGLNNYDSYSKYPEDLNELILNDPPEEEWNRTYGASLFDNGYGEIAEEVLSQIKNDKNLCIEIQELLPDADKAK